MRRALAAAAIAAAIVPATVRAESPRRGSFELAVGNYRPEIDSEFGFSPGHYRRAFGSDDGWMFRIAGAKALVRRVGSLEAGLSVGYFQQTGKGIGRTGEVSGDETSFRMVPVSAFLTYRFDWLAERYRIPLAPYARAGLERYSWWVTDGYGDVSEYGATNGWSITGGLALLLDFFDSNLAREFDNETGVNDTYLFFEIKRATVDDFGSGSSWTLSDTAFAGGLMFVF